MDPSKFYYSAYFNFLKSFFVIDSLKKGSKGISIF